MKLPSKHLVSGLHSRFVSPGVGGDDSHSPFPHSTKVSQITLEVAVASVLMCSVSAQVPCGKHLLSLCEGAGWYVFDGHGPHVLVDTTRSSPAAHRREVVVVVIVVVAVVVVVAIVVVVATVVVVAVDVLVVVAIVVVVVTVVVAVVDVLVVAVVMVVVVVLAVVVVVVVIVDVVTVVVTLAQVWHTVPPALISVSCSYTPTAPGHLHRSSLLAMPAIE